MLIIERSPMGRQNHLMLPVLGLVTLRALLGMFVLFGDKVASLRKFKRGEPRDKKIKAGTFFPWILYEFQIEKYGFDHRIGHVRALRRRSESANTPCSCQDDTQLC